jgi:16S rRNA processing protein RimM
VTAWRPERIVIGTVGRAHGLDGSTYLNGHGGAVEVRRGMPVRVGDRDTRIAARKGTDDHPVLRFELASSREDAEALRGLEVSVSTSLLREPEEDEYHHVDLLGCRVESDGASLGAVAAIHEYPANDVLELDTGALVPFVDEVVEEVDVPGRRIVVRPGVLADADA